MNYYPHHIGDFNSATRHLTRVERSLYRDLIELYYDTEQPLPADDFDRLARRVIALTEEERTALQYVLEEFFDLDGDVYRHSRCDEEIEKYRANSSAKAKAGKASAEARRKKAQAQKEQKRAKDKPEATGVEHPLNGCATNQEPRTNNQEKTKDSSSEAVASDVDGGADDSPLPENPKPEKFTPDDYRLAERMAQAVLRVAPRSKPPDISKWADTIRLMRERDELTLGEIADVFRFAHNDSFWRTNILSPTKLREQFAQLDAKMRNPTNEKRHTTSADRWAIDHEDTSWLTGASGSGDCIDGELDFPPNADDLHCLEAGRGGRH